MPRSIFLIFMAFGIVIAGASSYYYASCWSEVMAGRSWPSTQATITAIGIDQGEGSGSTYYPRLAYTYRVGGRTLYGSRIWLSGNQFYNGREGAEAFVGHYAVGQRVPVSYDPQDPEDSALLVENPPWQILLFTGFGLLWMGCALGFRLFDDSGDREKRFGKCRKCGAHLPFDQYMPAGSAATAELAAAGVPPCPDCGQADPLNARRFNPGCILFGIFFGGIWAIIAVAYFFVF